MFKNSQTDAGGASSRHDEMKRKLPEVNLDGEEGVGVSERSGKLERSRLVFGRDAVNDPRQLKRTRLQYEYANLE
jgi:hypothetical protein